MRRLLSHRDATVYLAGQSLSVIGDSALLLPVRILTQIPMASHRALSPIADRPCPAR